MKTSSASLGYAEAAAALQTVEVVTKFTDLDGQVRTIRRSYEFTAEQVEALKAGPQFTAEDLKRIKRRQRKTDALLLKMANATDEECVRLDDAHWRDIHAENRIVSIRRAKTRAVAAQAPRRTNRSSGRPRAQAARSSAKSGDSPDEPGEPEPDAADEWRWCHPRYWGEAEAKGVWR